MRRNTKKSNNKIKVNNRNGHVTERVPLFFVSSDLRFLII